GLTIYFESSRQSYYSLFVTTRDSPSSAFSTLRELTELHMGGEGGPYVTPDGSALYFHAYINSNFEIYRAQKRTGGFAPAEPLSVNTNQEEADPGLFDRTRTNH